MTEDFSGLPGSDLVERGLAELSQKLNTSHALLVAIAAPNLRRLGFTLPVPDELPDSPELALYRLLRRERPSTAYIEYNALLRRLVSFERALERERASAARRARST